MKQETSSTRLASIVKVVLVPLLGALATAWMEHRTSAVKERQDAAYAVTAPVLRDLQTEQVKLGVQVEILTKLITAHVLEHPAATPVVERPAPHRRLPPPQPPAAPSAGLSGYGGGSLGSGGGVLDQLKIAKGLRERPNIQVQQRSIPDSPDEALMMQKASKK